LIERHAYGVVTIGFIGHRKTSPDTGKHNLYMRLFAGLPGMTMSDAESFWFVSDKPAPGNTIL